MDLHIGGGVHGDELVFQPALGRFLFNLGSVRVYVEIHQYGLVLGGDDQSQRVLDGDEVGLGQEGVK